MKKLITLTLLSLFLQAEDKNITIKIDGMTCPLCTMAIKKSLKSTKGVKKAKVSLPKKMATVTFDNSETNTTILLNAIKKAGYKGEIENAKNW